MVIHSIRAGLLACLMVTIGCATKYNLTLKSTDNFSGKISLPDGAADRMIVRVDNTDNSWLHLRWSDAKIIGLTGFAVPVKTQPANPLTSVPPRSSVEYHLFPGHDYWPEGYYQNRRDGFATLLVYDSDYDRLINSTKPVLELYVPTCRGDAPKCSNDQSTEGWSMAYIKAAVVRLSL
jgi:hypothetical protein